ncbi:MAG: hypothetical protein MZV49_01925 [Rhodopseudomonas palustris]|nr:hypothetical protein [Rhodopseudomonas palustris]
MAARERGTACSIKRRGCCRIETGGDERRGVAGDDAFDRGDPGGVIGARR